MYYLRRKSFWFVFTMIAPLIFFTGYYAFKAMTSVYKKDLGNGVVIYADDYVKSGDWVFDCRYSRLVNRNALPVPASKLAQSKYSFGSMYYLSKADQETAKALIRATTATPDWYRNLRYVYSGLSEYSDITAHLFDLLTEYEGRTWGLRVREHIQYDGSSDFNITAEPYDPKTYVDYARAIETAAKSCPAPQ
ncbi:hypothetical protein KSS93_06800 [Pseudomonas xanthosomatis]|uniref:hypothetical protein n=1 Tax=Pseudomonas xanthosomatis TaxID=2842356 RepID=UPI001C3E7455|nr:hypothetical protein [Pseudomonas xanthosomatis]QXH47622.1 hypothetical protein KSS93_06800 [Pseudomonas xanthosomatis]